MIESYLEYWGLKKHPFLLAPDSNMVYVAGQYFECIERLKYAVNTQKGGALIVSEDAGLGKTTILLKLIDELKSHYNESFRYALVDHPTLDPSQMISYITKEVTGVTPYEDKLKNILSLKDSLIDIKKQGGKAIIIVDEGQLLCGKIEILQELRILINLNHENEYLHTFILSGQKPLWDEIKRLPEFWQRLPVRYYFMPLRFEETKELIRFRLNKAGLDIDRRIFTDEAITLIHKYSKGSPRTILALSDMALLVGFTDRAIVIGFKEIHKALDMMSGRGESLPYIIEKNREKVTVFNDVKTTFQDMKKKPDMHEEHKKRAKSQVKPFFIFIGLIAFIVVIGAGFKYFLSGGEKELPREKSKKISTFLEDKDSQVYEDGNVTNRASSEAKDGQAVKSEKDPEYNKEFVITKFAANIRSAPDITAQRIGMIFQGEIIKIKGEQIDLKGNRWYKVILYGNREGWVSESVGNLR